MHLCSITMMTIIALGVFLLLAGYLGWNTLEFSAICTDFQKIHESAAMHLLLSARKGSP